MAGKSHFRVTARLDESWPQPGTVTIDRGAGLFSVRPLRRRRVYELPLWAVADMVVARVIRAEVQARKAAKRKRP